MRTMRRAVIAAIAASAIVVPLAACSSSSGGGDGKITLNVQVFGSFGYKEAGLYAAYEKAHPNITINESSPQNETDYWNATQTRLAGGSGLGDINAIEVGRLAGVVQNQSDKFVDLNTMPGAKSYFSQFLPWKEKLAQTASGTQVAAGTDIGPVAMCYRPDLFKEAGLPTDPAAVGKLWSSWEQYVDVGKTFAKSAPSGTFWTDSAAGLFRAAMGVTGDKYTDKSGKLIWETSPTVKASWNLTVDAIDARLTKGLTQFTPDWNQSFSTNDYATLACPAWMLTYIKGQAGDKGSGKWAVTNAPAAGNVGGSYLAIPKTSQHQKEAWDLLKFLSSATSMQSVFEKAGNFPSNEAAISAVQSFKDPYFSDSPTGQYLGDSAKNLPTPQVIGPHDNDVETALMNGVNEIAQKGVSPDKAWADAKAAIGNAVG